MLKSVILALLLLPWHPHDELPPGRAYRVNAKGQLNLVDKTLIRGTLLMPGKYIIQHQVEEDGHWFVLMEVRPGTVVKPPLRVKATLLPATRMFSKTVVYARPSTTSETGDPYTIVNIDVLGENLEHGV